MGQSDECNCYHRQRTDTWELCDYHAGFDDAAWLLDPDRRFGSPAAPPWPPPTGKRWAWQQTHDGVWWVRAASTWTPGYPINYVNYGYSRADEALSLAARLARQAGEIT
jgi:hypothetical protein